MNNSCRMLCLSFLIPLAASALPIVVDPATPLTGTFAVEWNTKNQFENWTTTQVTGDAVSGGVLSGTTSGTDAQITRSNFTGPDLDLGFNDFIELRMRVPASYADNIQIYYGTTATTGFSGDRVITIPNATIPKDGALHTYRIDAGTEPWWRATLRDLRIDPGNVSGVAFAIDYLRVGDEPNPTVYQPRFTTKCPAAGGATPAEAYYGPGQAVMSMESKHFRFLWNNNVTTHTSWTTTMAKGTLRNLEEAWQVYVKILGYREPCFAIGTTSGTAYKLNVTSYYSGYWSGLDDFGGTSLAQLNITPDGLQVDPPTWVIPHELMHCFQFHNTSGNVNGEWYETHANYGRERWLNHYQNVYPNRSNIEALGVRDGHFMMSSGRNYYLTWPFMYYVDTNPDALSDLYDGLIAKVWQDTQSEEFPMMALDRLTPTTSLKDIVGYFARRCATWDFSSQAAMIAELNIQDPTRNARHLFTDLIQRADDPTWWRVPLEKAPAQGAYAMHELIPAGSGAGRVVTVNLRGLADAARGADWRASFIALSDTGVERYTPLWSTGSSSITLAADENKLYLSVAGTPNVFYYGGHDESIYHFRSHPSRSRFHYEVQVTGATPRERDNGSTAGLTQHSNGGGWKSVTVPASVYIGPNARVTGGSVSGDARIEDYAVVSGGTVNSSAVISGHAWVRGGTVTGNARVRDWSIVDSGTISGNARVLEHATVAANMQDTAVAKGSALHQSGGVLSGNAIVDGDYMFNKSLANGVTFGHQPFVGVPDNFTTATPTGLYAAYNFRAAHDSRALDQYGITDAFLVGSPVWSATDGERRGFLTFNGSSQSVALDRSVVDCGAFTFAVWVKPSGGSANQAVLWLGASTTRRMSLTTSDASGQTKFSIVNGGSEQTLTTTALPVGVWSHIAVTLNGTTGILYTNGVSAVSGSITIRPDALLAANTTTGAQHNYLARSEGSAMPMFQGSLDDAQFYTSALGAAQISPLAIPPSVVGDLLLSDSFTAENYDAASFNNNLATDQQGYLAPTTYTVVTGGQGWQAQHGNGATMLLVGDTGYNARASLNEDFALLANDFDQPLAFQVDAWVDTGSDTCWASVVLGNGQNLNADSSAAKFAIRPVRDGSLQVWVNGSQMPQASRSGNNFRIVLSDTDGIGSAFNGNGSKAVLYNGTTLIGTYTLTQLVPGDGYLTVGAQPNNGYSLVRIDNLSISKILPTSYIWGGGTGDWTDLNWRPGSVAGPTNSGLTGVVNAGTVTLGQATLGSFAAGVTLGADAQVVLNTTADIALGNAIVFSGDGAISKTGAGALTLTAANTYTGGTSIDGGTLITGAGGVGKGAVTLASGATLATTSASSTGLAALYYNNGIDQANIASLSALLAHFGANSPAPTLVQTAPSMNFAGHGSGFPPPYNSGAANFESFYSGKVNIATPGTYTFNTSSDDGSMLFIDGQVVVANNVFQPVTTRSGSIALTAGMHDIVIAYNQGSGGYGMNAQISGADNTTMADINTGNANITPDLVLGSLAGEGSVSLTTGNLITGLDNRSTTFTGVISGIGGLTKFGTGVQTLAGTNTYTGPTMITAGSLQIGNGGATGTLSAGSPIINNGTLIINRSNAVLQGSDFSASAITGSGSLIQAGAGTTTLTAANSYSGTTTITAGTLQIGNGGSTGSLYLPSVSSGNLTFGSTGAILDNSALVYTISGGPVNVNQSISGTGTLSVTGDQAVNFAADTSITTTGSQTYSATATSGRYYGFNLADNATVTLTSMAGNISMTGMVGTANGHTGKLVIDTRTGNGSVTLNTPMGVENVDYGLDALTVNAGSGAITFGTHGGLVWRTVKTISLTGGIINSIANQTDFILLAITNSFAGVFSGNLTGGGSLVKSGAGTLELTGDNSTSGGTTINGGTLVAYRNTVGTGAMVINNGGTLYVNDQWVLCGVNHHGVTGRNIGSLTIHAGGTMQLDAVNGFANGAQNLYLNGGLVTGGPNNHRGDLYLFDGNEQITAGNATNSTIESVIGVTGNNNTITVEANSTLSITGLVKDSDWTSSGTTPGGFIKAGTGTLTLSGGNSYSRLTDITAGTLVAANNTALGAGGFRGDTMTYIQDGATLALQGGISLDEHFHVWGSGVGGLGALRSLGGNNALTCSYLGGAGFALRSNTTIGVDADTLTISGFYEEGGSFSLTKVGSGTLVLTASTYTGGTLVESGTLVVGAGGVAKAAVTLASGATLATPSATSTGLAALYYSNAAISQGNIASLPALLAHFGANSPAPSLVQTAPSMNFGGDGSGFPAPYNSYASNFESFYSGKLNIATPGTYTFNTSSDDGSMLFIDGQVVVANNVFQPVTTRSGAIALTAGMHDLVIAFNQGGGGYGMNAQMSGPDNTTMVDINTANASITPDLVVGSLAGAGSVSLTTGNLLTGIDNSSTTFDGMISGIGSVTKFGTGTQSLAGTNTYTGATTVIGGTLRIDGDSSGVPGALTVASGAFLGGHGSYGGNITLNDGAGLNCDLTLTDSTLTCGQLSFTNLDFADCTFTVAHGVGYRAYTVIEASSLGTTTFANAGGTIDNAPAKLYISGNKLVLRVGHAPTVISFF